MRRFIKTLLGFLPSMTAATGATLLIYHRVGGDSGEELDVPLQRFRRHLEILESYEVVSLDAALDRLDAGDSALSIVLTFDDGFTDVYENAWPLLRDRGIPFTIYLATAYMGTTMRWERSTARGSAGQGMEWHQLQEMVDSGLCTIGNHTHNHVPPDLLTAEELDTCNKEIRTRLGLIPQHFTYPWGIPVSEAKRHMKDRFRSASTGIIGRNHPVTDRLELRRVPVRCTDPDIFFKAKLRGNLWPEQIYAKIVESAKRLGLGQRQGSGL